MKPNNLKKVGKIMKLQKDGVEWRLIVFTMKHQEYEYKIIGAMSPFEVVMLRRIWSLFNSGFGTSSTSGKCSRDRLVTAI